MAQGMDFCDVTTALRPYFFPKDRDVYTQPNRSIFVGSGGNITVTGGDITVISGDITIDVGDVILNDGTVKGPGGGEIAVPIGGIIGWSGAIVDIPTGWQLCDGTNGTPDTRNLLIMGSGDKYNPLDTGGAETVDASHLHANGTLAADNESTHTHGSGTLATDTAATHRHGPGSYDTASDTHNHADTFTIENDTHDHAVNAGTTANDTHRHGPGDLTTAVVGTHTHAVGSYVIGTPTSVASMTAGGVSMATNVHIHYLSGSSAADGGHGGLPVSGDTDNHAHNHDPGSLDTDNDTHNHTISGSVSNDSHDHAVDAGVSGYEGDHAHTVNTGSTAAGAAHGHTISGDTATGGDTTLNILNPYIAWGWIMRMS